MGNKRRGGSIGPPYVKRWTNYGARHAGAYWSSFSVLPVSCLPRRSTCTPSTPNRAEELAVEVFLKWWRHPQAHGEQAEGWLYRTSVREALDELRTEVR